MQMTAISRMPPGFNSGIASSVIGDEIDKSLNDHGIEVIDGDLWNGTVEANTPETYSLPNAVKPLSDFVEIKGQEINSSCFGAGLTALAERQHFVQTKTIKRFCMWPTYMLGQIYTGSQLYGRDSGTVPSDGIKVAVLDGFLPVETAKKLLPESILNKWGGDVYPRNYYNGRGSFEAAGQRAYAEACSIYEPILKSKEIRDEMRQYVMPTVVRFRSHAQVVDAERRQSAAALECHVWGSSMDSDPDYLKQFPGPPPQRGSQHGHHATYIAGLTPDSRLIKANSWRPHLLLKQAIAQGSQEIDGQEWGDDGCKTWIAQAHENMMRHRASYVYGFSNMPKAVAHSRVQVIDTNEIF